MPSPALCTDNGAMVAVADALAHGERTPLDVDAEPNLPIAPGIARRAPRKARRRPPGQ